MAVQIVLIVVCILASACFSASETALFSVSMIRIRTLSRQNDRTAKTIEKMRDDPQTLLGAILLGNTLVIVTATSLTTAIAIEYFGDAAVGIATGLMIIVTLIVGECIPKAYAAHNNERVAYVLALPVYGLTKLLRPILTLVNAVVGLAVRHEGPPAPPMVSEEEIKTMTQMGVRAGTVEKGEKELIERVFLFNDITAHDVMTPREHMVCLDGNKTLAETMPLIQAAGYSRYPVYGQDKKEFAGIIHIKNVLEDMAGTATREPGTALVRDLAEPATFIPKTKVIDDLLREMQKHRIHMALVVNEFGSVVGLVTLEDLLEELVGEIADESDIDELIIKRIDKNNIVCHGDAEITDVNRFFNTRLVAPPHKTISWIILKEFGGIPNRDQEVALGDGLTATIEEIAGLRIHKVRLSKAATEKDNA